MINLTPFVAISILNLTLMLFKVIQAIFLVMSIAYSTPINIYIVYLKPSISLSYSRWLNLTTRIIKVEMREE
jgi:hypothetical protein